jgi:cysteinyl-tRNA synthetase
VTLHLYDTATRSLRAFEPLEPGKASIYLCGLTTQGPPHIGHVRNWINMDILRRWLEHTGSEVTFVRNVTDIDDKILDKSAAGDEQWWALSFRNEREIISAEDSLGCRPPTYEPRATGHVTEMVELMQRLIDSGHAYVADGDVYFDVRSYPAYGQLSGQRVDEMQAAGDSVGDTRKHDPRDFALWKSAKPGEPSWPTPWGRGRPGWHLECSAMATKYLGPAFDIHGGGLDLVFPHHENELAQSSALGHEFAAIWMHNGLLESGGEKMSKSLGNDTTIRGVVDGWGRETALLLFLGGHWRKPLDFDEGTLAQAKAQVDRLRNVFRSPSGRGGDWAAFEAALDDDFNTPEALAIMHGWRDHDLLLRALSLFGLASLAEQVDAPAEVRSLAEARLRAREAKDFAESDRLRDEIAAAGWDVRDVAGGFELVPQ